MPCHCDAFLSRTHTHTQWCICLYRVYTLAPKSTYISRFEKYFNGKATISQKHIVRGNLSAFAVCGCHSRAHSSPYRPEWWSGRIQHKKGVNRVRARERVSQRAIVSESQINRQKKRRRKKCALNKTMTRRINWNHILLMRLSFCCCSEFVYGVYEVNIIVIFGILLWNEWAWARARDSLLSIAHIFGYILSVRRYPSI